jgi:hypothetical protein
MPWNRRSLARVLCVRWRDDLVQRSLERLSVVDGAIEGRLSDEHLSNRRPRRAHRRRKLVVVDRDVAPAEYSAAVRGDRLLDRGDGGLARALRAREKHHANAVRSCSGQ